MAKKKTIQEKLQAIVNEEYSQKPNRLLTLLYPWVMVRVLPKEENLGLIIVPEKSQHKPMYEAIVLKTWQPRWVVERDEADDPVSRWITSSLEPGDHIIYPHFDGVPIPGVSDPSFSLEASKHGIILIREFIWDAKGGVPAKIHVQRMPIRQELEEHLFGAASMTSLAAHNLAASLLEHYDIIPKNQKLMTRHAVNY